VVPSGFSPDNLPSELLEELHTVGPDEMNAEIVTLVNGVEPKWGRRMYRRRLAEKLGAEIPEVPSELVTEELEEEVTLGEPEPAELRKGLPPMEQLILRECPWEEGRRMDELVDAAKDMGWFDELGDLDVGKEVKKTVDDLLERELLTYNSEEETYHSGPREIEYTSKEGLDMGEGLVYPVVRLMRKECRENRRLRRWKLLDIVDDWGWTSSREASRYWLDKSLELGYLREVEESVFEPHRGIS